MPVKLELFVKILSGYFCTHWIILNDRESNESFIFKKKNRSVLERIYGIFVVEFIKKRQLDEICNEIKTLTNCWWFSEFKTAWYTRILFSILNLIRISDCSWIALAITIKRLVYCFLGSYYQNIVMHLQMSLALDTPSYFFKINIDS